MTQLSYADRVQEYAQNVGLGSFGLLGASASNLRTFQAAGLSGRTVCYTAQHRTSGQWEVGIGVFTAPATLTRLSIICNSSGTTNPINFTGGVVDVWNDLSAEKIISLNDDDSLSLPGALHVVGAADFGSIADAGVIGGGTWEADVIAGAFGGTGVANTGKTINLGGNLSTSDALTFTLTGPTSVTLPTSGTLVNDAVASLNNLANVGTIVTGTWNAGVIPGAYGGTGVANVGKTITLGGNFTIAGAHNLTVTITADTTVTLPTSGTLVNTAGNVATATALQNPRTINGVSFNGTSDITVTAAAGTLTGTTLAANVVTSSLTSVGVIVSGTWQGQSISTTYTDAKIKTVSGTVANITVGGTATDPVISIAASYAGQSSITTLGTIVTGAWNGSSIANTYTDAKVASISGVANRTTVTGTTSVPIVDIAATYVGQASITTLGTIVTGVWSGTAISNTYLASGIDVAKITVGATLPANITTSSLTTVGTITSGAWTATAVGTLYGGTGLTSYATGDILYASGLNTLSKLGGNTTVVRQFLSGTGTGVNAQAPAWATIVSADVSDATNANTVNKIVLRDGSGNFSAGTITAALTGNASSATALQTARTIWGQSFDGTGNVTGAITYGGVTLSNAVTGTGNMVLSASPTFSGTVGGALTFSGALTLSAALTYGGVTLSNAVTGTGNMVLSASPTFTGTAAFATVTTSSTINGQTISSAANFTGSVAITTTLTVTGQVAIGSATAASGILTTRVADGNVHRRLVNAAGSNVWGEYLTGGGLIWTLRDTIGNADYLTLSTSVFTVSTATTAVQALTAADQISFTKASSGGIVIAMFAKNNAASTLNNQVSILLGNNTGSSIGTIEGGIHYINTNAGDGRGALKFSVYTGAATAYPLILNADTSATFLAGISATTGTFSAEVSARGFGFLSGATTSVAGGPTPVVNRTADGGALTIVSGNSGGNIFSDLVFWATTGGATVLSSKTVSGAPAVRTYTVSSSALQLSMAAGTYTITSAQLSL